MLEWVWHIALAVAEEPRHALFLALSESGWALALGLVYGPRRAARLALVAGALSLPAWVMPLAAGAVLMSPPAVPL